MGFLPLLSRVYLSANINIRVLKLFRTYHFIIVSYACKYFDEACLLASGLSELQLEGCILLDQKTVTVTGALPEQKQYLKPLYDFLNQSSQRKPVKIEKVLEAYTYSVTDKNITALFDSVGMSLKICNNRRAGTLNKCTIQHVKILHRGGYAAL